MDLRAIERIAAGNALGEDEVGADGAHRILHPDIEVVDGQGEARQPARLEDDTGREGVRLLRRQVRVAARLAVILVGDVVAHVAELRRRNTREGTLGGGEAGAARTRAGLRSVDQAGCIRRTRAGIGAAVEGHVLRREELDDVRGADGTVDAGAELDVAHRRPLALDLPGVGREAVRQDRVLVITIAAADLEQLEERPVLDDRQLRLGEEFLHVELTVEADRGTALAGEIAGREFGVRRELQLLLAILDARVDGEAMGRPRRLQAVFAELRGDGGVRHRLLRVAAREARGLQVVERSGGDAARSEDVVGNAVLVRTRKHRATDRLPVRRVRDHIERLDRALDREVVEVGLGEDHTAILVGGVVREAAAEIALHARDDAVIGVLEVVAATASLDVAPADVENALVIGIAVLIEEHRGR